MTWASEKNSIVSSSLSRLSRAAQTPSALVAISRWQNQDCSNYQEKFEMDVLMPANAAEMLAAARPKLFGEPFEERVADQLVMLPDTEEANMITTRVKNQAGCSEGIVALGDAELYREYRQQGTLADIVPSEDAGRASATEDEANRRLHDFARVETYAKECIPWLIRPILVWDDFARLLSPIGSPAKREARFTELIEEHRRNTEALTNVAMRISTYWTYLDKKHRRDDGVLARPKRGTLPEYRFMRASSLTHGIIEAAWARSFILAEWEKPASWDRWKADVDRAGSSSLRQYIHGLGTNAYDACWFASRASAAEKGLSEYQLNNRV